MTRVRILFSAFKILIKWQPHWLLLHLLRFRRKRNCSGWLSSDWNSCPLTVVAALPDAALRNLCSLGDCIHCRPSSISPAGESNQVIHDRPCLRTMMNKVPEIRKHWDIGNRKESICLRLYCQKSSSRHSAIITIAAYLWWIQEV